MMRCYGRSWACWLARRITSTSIQVKKPEPSQRTLSRSRCSARHDSRFLFAAQPSRHAVLLSAVSSDRARRNGFACQSVKLALQLRDFVQHRAMPMRHTSRIARRGRVGVESDLPSEVAVLAPALSIGAAGLLNVTESHPDLKSNQVRQAFSASWIAVYHSR
jgi:hypothetical protein